MVQAKKRIGPGVLKLGATIRKLRLQTGMSQEAYSQYLGVHRSYLWYVESDSRTPSYFMLNMLALTFGMRLSEFIREAEKEQERQ